MKIKNMARRRERSLITLSPLVCVLLGVMCAVAGAQVNVTTQHNDIGRTGQNLSETILNTTNVNATQFGKLFSQPVDGLVYAQPLYVSSVAINGVTHNVVFVATEHDTVYAFDADSAGSPLWQASMLSTAHGAAAGATTVPWPKGSDIDPEVGITGTPVIDPASQTLYVVSNSVENTAQVLRLHALDLASGAEKLGGPVTISGSVPGTGAGSVNGTLTFNAQLENQRPGLLLLDGIVYVSFAAHEDTGNWHGWIFGYNTATLAQTGIFCTTPNGTGGGIWMSGAGLAADQLDPAGHPYGRMFVPTGNGDFNATAPYGAGMNYGQTHLNLDLTNGAFTVTDEFTTNQQATLTSGDKDVDAGGLLIIPTQTAGKYPHLLVQAGKAGTVYVLNRDSLGGYNTTADQSLQQLAYAVGGPGVWSSPAYWNGNIYYWGQFDNLKSFPLVNGVLSATPTKSTEQQGFPGATPAISANGTTQGIVWTIDSSAYSTNGPAILRAHDASNVTKTLYSSTANATRDAAGIAVKFAVPTIANGKVYVGAARELDVYGLLNGMTQTPAPIITPGSQIFTGSVSVTISDIVAGATIYYTTDATAATTTSKVYSGPISVNATQTLNAVAVAPGLTTSVQASATYTSTTSAATPTFSPTPNSYATAQKVTISDASPGVTIYYTADGSTPTSASSLYTGPLTVGAKETLKAIAVGNGYSTSAVGIATYTIVSAAPVVNYPASFTATGLNLVGATVTNNALVLSDGGTGEARASWFNAPVGVQNFTTDFSFQDTSANADGFAFVIQNSSSNVWAVGGSGGGLGYSGIGSSVAVKFDLYSNAGEGPDSTGFYTNGAMPTLPALDMRPSGVNLHSGDVMNVHMVYDGTTLAMTIFDTVTGASFSASTTLNIPSIVGSNTAYVGFTAGTGGLSAVQTILSWTYSAGSPATVPPAATPTFSPPAGTYASAQMVSISDTTAGTTIYYTTDGSTPTTASSVYTSPVSVSATETVRAFAVGGGYSASAFGSAAYTITQTPTAAAPTFSPVAGTYTTAQSVTISDTTPGATIYYTTDGSVPTTASAVYAGPVSVTATETLRAIATASGYTTSPVASAVYTITSSSGSSVAVNYSSGFTSTGLSLVGASISNGALMLTDGGSGEQRAAWYMTPVNVQSFTADFRFQDTSANADGFAFVIQNSSSNVGAVGGNGGGLGYSGIGSSVAVKFDLYSNAGEGPDSTGFYVNGATPTVPALDMTSSGVNLHSGDIMSVHLVYDGTTLTMTITDTVTAASFTTSTAINIPTTVGANTAYVGFTGGTGGLSAIQKILSWTYSTSASGTPAPAAATPNFSPAAGTYTTAQSVTISDATSGATIYYTTDGSTPTTASPVYSAPITVSVTETLKAIATATGYSTSSVGSAAYTIATPAATPNFSPAAGTYATAQTVTIGDATPGATIYYTTDGSTPTTTSPVYSAPITVSATQTLKAIATAAGYSTSAVGTATYTISAGPGTPVFDYSGGFGSTGINLVGATVSSGTLTLTDGGAGEQRAAWYMTPVNVQRFTTDFRFQATSASADGFTFTIQNSSANMYAVGSNGGGLGYSGIGSSVAVKFDLYSNAGEGPDSTGFYVNGATPTVPALDMTSSGVNLHSGNIMRVHLVYDGTTLTMTITDTVTAASFTASTAINIPTTVGANTAYVGFTGGTGGLTAIQKVLGWTYTVN